jgi:hypothetical protein
MISRHENKPSGSIWAAPDGGSLSFVPAGGGGACEYEIGRLERL